MGVVLAKFYLYELLLLRALEENCFKVLKVPLNKYHWNIHFCKFCTKNWLWSITGSKDGLALAESYLFELFLGKVVFKVQKLSWTNIFTIEIFLFASFVPNVDFEQFQKVGLVLFEFYLSELTLLRVLAECCFKAPGVLFDEYFNHWNFHFCYFCKKNSILSDHCFKRWARHSLSFIFLLGLWWRLMESSLKAPKTLFGKYFYHLKIHFC